jgi:regulator of protease activity HflC (stomatin/prohibitin superfamily)
VITDPGVHVCLPFMTKWQAVQITVQTDLVENIPCGTRGGVVIYFEKIEVVNKLKKEFVYETMKEYGPGYDKIWIFDKIHHEINQFCSKNTLQEVYIDLFDTVDEAMQTALQKDVSKHAPGITIMSVRVTKPKLPEAIRRSYEQLEGEKMKFMIAQQHQLTVEKEAQTERKRAVAEAEKLKEVAVISQNQAVHQKETEKRIAEIEDEMHLHKEQSKSDAMFYQAQKEAESNKLKLTPEFLQLSLTQALGNNTKIYFGNQIPSMFLDTDAFMKKSQ